MGLQHLLGCGAASQEDSGGEDGEVCNTCRLNDIESRVATESAVSVSGSGESSGLLAGVPPRPVFK